MKICRILLNLLMLASAFAQTRTAEDTGPHPRVGRLTLDAQNVTVLRLKPGYVSSVRLPEEVSSVVVGDPKNFRAEHSEAEPRLVFLKPLGNKPSETNAPKSFVMVGPLASCELDREPTTAPFALAMCPLSRP